MMRFSPHGVSGDDLLLMMKHWRGVYFEIRSYLLENKTNF
jgi:hypothetical protein